MDSGDIASAMGGFMMGQMFAGQTRPTFYNFVAIRFDRDFDFVPFLKEVTKDAFFDVSSNPQADLELEFTEKAELKVFNKPKRWGDKPLLLFLMCFWCWFKKDAFFSIALRNEIGSPIPQNIALLRHTLISLNAKKVKYELW